jgi:hypothetical protein
MTDRWQNRPEPAPDEAVVSWHMLLRDYPEVVDLARQVTPISVHLAKEPAGRTDHVVEGFVESIIAGEHVRA